jgi:cytochrome b involved in lipid metabolism
MSKDTKLFTFEEVFKHNKEGDIWVIYEGHVLDVTKFNTHPGGPEVLWELAGIV